MPLTYSDITKVITAEYIVGDLKGNSLANAWVVDDFYQAITDAGYPDDWKKQGSSHLLDGVAITIQGDGTYVWFYNSTIEWIGSPTHLIRVYSPAYFQVGRESMSSTNKQGGCSFVVNTSALKYFYFAGYVKVYDSFFSSSSISIFSIQMTGNADDPLIIDRCTFINAGYAAISSISGFAPTNCRIIDCMLKNNTYGIDVRGTGYNEVSGIKAVGNLIISAGQVGEYRVTNLKSALGTLDVRAYYSNVVWFNIIDSLVVAKLAATHVSTAGYTGAKAAIYSYSTFSFYVENGVGAIVKVYNKDEVLLLDDVLLANGQLLGKELKYWERSQEKIQDNPNVYVNVNTRYDPFRLTITKTGYQDIIIENINIVDGEPTNIFANMIFPELQISAVTITDCATIGASDGQLEITAQGGDGSYTYSINGVDYQAGNTFSGLTAGDYTVYVKDGEDTVADFEVAVSEPVYKNVYVDRRISGTVTAKTISGSVSPIQISGNIKCN